jgi:hypothetical protein
LLAVGSLQLAIVNRKNGPELLITRNGIYTKNTKRGERERLQFPPYRQARSGGYGRKNKKPLLFLQRLFKRWNENLFRVKNLRDPVVYILQVCTTCRVFVSRHGGAYVRLQASQLRFGNRHGIGSTAIV